MKSPTVHEKGPKSYQNEGNKATTDQYIRSVNEVHLIKILEISYIILTKKQRQQNITPFLNPCRGNKPQLWCTFYNLDWIA